MYGKSRISRQITFVAVGAAIALGAAASLAGELPEVTVKADRVMIETVDHPSGSSGSAERFSLSRGVSYADLDLSKAAGAAELEKRVKDTADAICKKLDALYPETVTSGHECEKSTTKAAMVKVHALIAAAAPH
ncbi:MAG: UrcA family protein [Steroidobacterales bacterium]